MPTTPRKEWRFELIPLGSSLLIDFLTQAEDPKKIVDPSFSILLSKDWDEVTLWGARRFAYIRREDERRPEIRAVKNSRRPTLVTQLRTRSERILCHIENSWGAPEGHKLSFHAEGPKLDVKLEIDPSNAYVEVWRAGHLRVYDGPEPMDFYGQVLRERISDFRADEAVLREHSKVLPFTKGSAS